MPVRSELRRLRGLAPEIVLTLGMVVAGLALWQAVEIAQYLRGQARDASRIYGRFVAALSDTTRGPPTVVLLDLVSEITASGLPLVVTDTAGHPTQTANLPLGMQPGDPAILPYVRRLDRTNPPVEVPGGHVHFGSLPAERRLTWLTMLQLALLSTAVAVGIWAYRSASHRDRDRLWVAMARESAHQLGTPLMSADAWIDRLEDNPAVDRDVVQHLRGDLERLHRVAQRFERIGRPARRDHVSLGTLVERVATYFGPRLPKRANPIHLRVHAPSVGPAITADPVLIEWAVEALIRNSVDALSGRGGTIEVRVQSDGRSARLSVEDDGPGVPMEVRGTLFEPGVTTKTGGWGIGLALARRIVEDVHGGRLELGPSPQGGGALFVAALPMARQQPTDP